jgi:hypothetical protein
MSGDIVLHVGLHKTGTTSLQAFLASNRLKLERLGFAYYKGLHSPDNHVDLHAVPIRPEQGSPFLANNPTARSKIADAEVRQHISALCERERDRVKIFSNEGISYLKYRDEVEALRALFPDEDVRVVIYLRDPQEYLASYRVEMKKHKMPEVIRPDSFAYTEDDTWLIDYEGRLRAFREIFPAFHAIDYDAEVRQCGSVIPSFLRLLGIEHEFARDEWVGFWLNRRLPAARRQG